jgi:hypothetical protein
VSDSKDSSNIAGAADSQSPTGGSATNPGQKDVPLGPACLVVFVFFLVGLCIVVAIMSFMLTGKQGGRAAYALREQLIPWVDQSALSPTDQEVIIENLMDLASKMERDELTARQLTRLGARLTDSTILQWGVVEEINRRAQASEGFTPEEKEDFAKTCDRWLRCAGEGRLSMTEMEFAFQSTASKDPRSGRLNLRESLADDQLREFHRRVLAICEKYKTSTEPYEKSVSQVFRLMMDDGLSEQ